MNENEFIKTNVISEIKKFCKDNKLEYILDGIFRFEDIFNPTNPPSFWFDALSRNPAFTSPSGKDKLPLFMAMLELFNEQRKINSEKYSYFEGYYYRWYLSLNNGVVIEPRVYQNIAEIIFEEKGFISKIFTPSKKYLKKKITDLAQEIEHVKTTQLLTRHCRGRYSCAIPPLSLSVRHKK